MARGGGALCRVLSPGAHSRRWALDAPHGGGRGTRAELRWSHVLLLQLEFGPSIFAPRLSSFSVTSLSLPFILSRGAGFFTSRCSKLF